MNVIHHDDAFLEIVDQTCMTHVLSKSFIPTCLIIYINCKLTKVKSKPPRMMHFKLLMDSTPHNDATRSNDVVTKSSDDM